MSTVEKREVNYMDEKFDIQQYLSDGVEQVVKDALRATFKDPRESAFLGKFALASAKATRNITGQIIRKRHTNSPKLSRSYPMAS